MRPSTGRSCVVAASMMATVQGGMDVALSASDDVVISQKNKRFQPSDVTFQQGHRPW